MLRRKLASRPSSKRGAVGEDRVLSADEDWEVEILDKQESFELVLAIRAVNAVGVRLAVISQLPPGILLETTTFRGDVVGVLQRCVETNFLFGRRLKILRRGVGQPLAVFGMRYQEEIQGVQIFEDSLKRV